MAPSLIILYFKTKADCEPAQPLTFKSMTIWVKCLYIPCILIFKILKHYPMSLHGYVLAQLSRTLTGEFIGYQWSGVRPSSSVHIFKHLLLQNRLANQSQILYGASLGRGNKSLFMASGPHEQDGRQAHAW